VAESPVNMLKRMSTEVERKERSRLSVSSMSPTKLHVLSIAVRPGARPQFLRGLHQRASDAHS
jgi:hypothetical protein